MKYWIAIIVAVFIILGGILGTASVEGQELPTETLTIIETVTIPGPTETITEFVTPPAETVTETINPDPITVTETETETIVRPGDTVTVTETETVVVAETERSTERETEFRQPSDEPEPSPQPTETTTETDIDSQIVTKFVERFQDLSWWQLTLFMLAGTLIAGAVYYFGWVDRAQNESTFLDDIINRIRKR